MVDSMRGPGGGPFVAPLNSGYLARTSSLYFHLSGATYSELLDTWAALEPTLAERAAKLPASRTKREMFTPFLAYDTESHVERSEEHTSELQSLMRNSYAVFCLKTKKPQH